MGFKPRLLVFVQDNSDVMTTQNHNLQLVPSEGFKPRLLVFVPDNSDVMKTQKHKSAIGALRGLRTPAAGICTRQF